MYDETNRREGCDFQLQNGENLSRVEGVDEDTTGDSESKATEQDKSPLARPKSRKVAVPALADMATYTKSTAPTAGPGG